MLQQWPRFTLLQQFASTMASGHGNCLAARKNATDKQVDTEGPIRCSSLTLEREEHLKHLYNSTGMTQYVTATTFLSRTHGDDFLLYRPNHRWWNSVSSRYARNEEGVWICIMPHHFEQRNPEQGGFSVLQKGCFSTGPNNQSKSLCWEYRNWIMLVVISIWRHRVIFHYSPGHIHPADKKTSRDVFATSLSIIGTSRPRNYPLQDHITRETQYHGEEET
jgi:hypothetical protein